METRLKTFTVSIPEGKRAVWNEQGILQLVDEKKANEPKDVTERIKTFYDAYSELTQMANHNFLPAQKLIKDYGSARRMGMSDDIVAYMQLRIIICALNEGWTPQFTENERRWYPYFTLWTEDELKDKSDEWKDDRQLLRWGGNASDGSLCGVAYSSSYYSWSNAPACIGSRLAYKTKALATFAGLTFAPVYARFFLGDKAKGLKPWREVEGKEEPADEEEES